MYVCMYVCIYIYVLLQLVLFVRPFMSSGRSIYSYVESVLRTTYERENHRLLRSFQKKIEARNCEWNLKIADTHTYEYTLFVGNRLGLACVVKLRKNKKKTPKQCEHGNHSLSIRTLILENRIYIDIVTIIIISISSITITSISSITIPSWNRYQRKLLWNKF